MCLILQYEWHVAKSDTTWYEVQFLFPKELRKRKQRQYGILQRRKKGQKKLQIRSTFAMSRRASWGAGRLRFRCEGELRSPEPQILAMTTDSYFVTGNSTVTVTGTSNMDVILYYKRGQGTFLKVLPFPQICSELDEIWTQCLVWGPLNLLFCVFHKKLF